MTKHEERECALILLFEMDLNGSSFEETLEVTEEAYDLVSNKTALDLVKSVLAHKDDIDEIITRFSTTRVIARIPKINLNIMRIAICEMLYNDKVPDKVAINEAIELSKEYADKQDSSFISGLLGTYYREKNNE